VFVLVMRIRKMGVRMGYRLVPVHMGVLGARRHGEVMLMLMVLVVDVFVFVHQRFVGVHVLVVLGQMKPDAQRHQRTGD